MFIFDLCSVKRRSKALLCNVSQLADLESAFVELEKLSKCLPLTKYLKPFDFTILTDDCFGSMGLPQAIESAKKLADEIKDLENKKFDRNLTAHTVQQLSDKKRLYLEYFVYLACFMWTIHLALALDERKALGQWYTRVSLRLPFPQYHTEIEQSYYEFQYVVKGKYVGIAVQTIPLVEALRTIPRDEALTHN
jgi:hypothetical protein